jgi:hypothetical protein
MTLAPKNLQREGVTIELVMLDSDDETIRRYLALQKEKEIEEFYADIPVISVVDHEVEDHQK